MALRGAEPPQCGAHVAGEGAEVVGASIGQDSFGELPDLLIGIELGSVGGEGLDAQPGEALEQGADEWATVDLDAVPEHDDGPAEMGQQGPQEGTDVRRAQVLVGMTADVQPAAVATGTQGQGRDDRNPIVPLPVVQYGRLASRGPGAPHRGRQEEAALVDEDEVGAQPRGVFFTRGQSRSCHRAMAASSRSSARRSGFWALQPH